MLLARPEDAILVVCHSLPVAYALGAREGIQPGARVPLAENATPYPFTRRRARARRRRARAWLARTDLVMADCPRVDVLERIERHIRRHEPDRARRRGALPRLRRRRLDLPLARAARARLPRLGAPRRPRPARRGVGRATRASAPRCSAPRSSGPTGAGCARPSCATSATRSAPDRLRATGHTASDQVETILYRLVTSGNDEGDQAAARGRRRAAAAAALARGDRGLLPRARARVPGRLVERRHDARA